MIDDEPLANELVELGPHANECYMIFENSNNNTNSSKN